MHCSVKIGSKRRGTKREKEQCLDSDFFGLLMWDILQFYEYAYLIFVTRITTGGCEEKICHVEKIFHMTDCHVEKCLHMTNIQLEICLYMVNKEKNHVMWRNVE